MDVSSVVNVSVSRLTQGLSQQGFGTQLLLGPNVPAGSVLTFTSIAGVAATFPSSYPEYLAAVAVFSQSPHPQKLKMATLSTKVGQVDTVTPDATVQAVTTYVVTLDGTSYSFTSSATPTASAVVTGLIALINGDANASATASGTNTLILTAKIAGVGFVTTPGAKLSLSYTTLSVGTATDIATAQALDFDWYMLHTTDTSAATIKDAARAVEAMNKLYLVRQTAATDSGIATNSTTDIASFLKGKNYYRTGIAYESVANDFFEAAMASRVLPLAAGSESWEYKSLAAVTTDNWSPTVVGYLESKNASYFVPCLGVAVTKGGKTAAGEWIDVMRGIDQLVSDMQGNVFTLLITRDKVPYTQTGLDMVQAQVTAALLKAQRNNFISTYTVTTPDLTTVSNSDKANRILNNVKWTAVLQGAIRLINISGVVTY